MSSNDLSGDTNSDESADPTSVPEAVGIIAGNGVYPKTFARAARKAGVSKLIAAAFLNETEPEFESEVDETGWFRVGQLSKLIRFFQKHQVAHAVMTGQIAPRNLFEFRPDVRTLKMLGKVKERNAETLFGAIAGELENDGIVLLPATTFLDDLLPGPGNLGGPELSAEQEEDAAFGIRIAKEVSRLDIGQCVVVKKGTVLAVEAFEGTNETLRRGGALGKGGAMMIKVSKPEQDLRFDVPCIGPATIETARDAGVNAVIVEAGRTLLLDKEEVLRLCAKRKISLAAWEAEMSED